MLFFKGLPVYTIQNLHTTPSPHDSLHRQIGMNDNAAQNRHIENLAAAGDRPIGHGQGGNRSHHRPVAQDSSLDQSAKKITRKGGVTTITVIGVLSGLAITVFHLDQDHLVTLFLKCSNLLSLVLSWHWISSKDEIRDATDAMFLGWLKMFTECFTCSSASQ